VEPRAVTTRLTVRDDMVNGFGVCHGGVTFSLADSALAFASNTHGRVTVSIENSITYPKRVSVGDVLTAVAEEESATNRLAFYRVTVLRSDDPSDVVALFRGTVYKTNQVFLPA
jgi:acyl-CoA thioesterase